MKKRLLGFWLERTRFWLRAAAAFSVCVILVSYSWANERDGGALVSRSTPIQTGKDYAEKAGGLSLEMIWVPGGTFNMGGGFGEEDERPIHAVTLEGFWLGKFEVTNGQYRSFLADSGYDGAGEANFDYLTHFKLDTPFSTGDNYPILYVSWRNAQAFCQWLSRKTGRLYSLPSEAQWEYACRAGNSGKWHSGNDERELGRYAWFGDNSGDKTHVVGTKKPNAFGLHDMHGNVSEWCLDWYGAEYYSRSPSRNPANTTLGEVRALRGGAWRSSPPNCRSTNRHKNPPDSASRLIGFRVARTQQ